MDCLLIADDLTGACDAAAPFAARGRHTVVLTSLDAPSVDAEVIAISTDTRDAPAEEIRRVLASVARRFSDTRPRILFKKIDSTLRGNPAVEIAAAREAFACCSSVVCPAFPAMGRIVERGWLRVTSDPAFAPLDVRPLASHDAACDADLDRIVTTAAEAPVLWAGSAGLAAALARCGVDPLVRTGRPRPALPHAVLFCIGSDHPVSLRQTAELTTSGRPHVLLQTGWDMTADTVRATFSNGLPGAIVLSGGATASLLCRALGVHSIELYDELSPGIPRGVLRGGEFDGTMVVTKSGGFGAPDTLIRIADYFSCPNLQTTAR